MMRSVLCFLKSKIPPSNKAHDNLAYETTFDSSKPNNKGRTVVDTTVVSTTAVSTAVLSGQTIVNEEVSVA